MVPAHGGGTSQNSGIVQKFKDAFSNFLSPWRSRRQALSNPPSEGKRSREQLHQETHAGPVDVKPSDQQAQQEQHQHEAPHAKRLKLTARVAELKNGMQIQSSPSHAAAPAAQDGMLPSAGIDTATPHLSFWAPTQPAAQQQQQQQHLQNGRQASWPEAHASGMKPTALDFTFATPGPPSHWARMMQQQPGQQQPQQQHQLHHQPQQQQQPYAAAPTLAHLHRGFPSMARREPSPWASQHLRQSGAQLPATGLHPARGGTPMSTSRHASPYIQPNSRPSQLLRNSFLGTAATPHFTAPSFEEYEKLLYWAAQPAPRPARPAPAPAPKYRDIIDLATSADEDIEKAAEARQQHKATLAQALAHNQQIHAIVKGLSGLHTAKVAQAAGTGPGQAVQQQVRSLQAASAHAAQVESQQEQAARLAKERAQQVRATLHANVHRKKQQEEAAAAALREQRRKQEEQRVGGARGAAVAEPTGRQAGKGRVQTAAHAKARQQQQEEEDVVEIISSDDEAVESSAAAALPRRTQQLKELYLEEEEQEEEEGEEAEVDYTEQDEELPDEDEEEGQKFRQTAAERATWDRVFSHPDKSQLLINYKNYEISRGKLQCLAARQWLNDEAINMYMLLLQERDTALRSTGSAPRCHFFNSFFLSKLYRDSSQYSYKAVQRWTTAKKLQASGQASSSLLDVDRIVMPVNCGNVHWTCCMIDIKNKQLVYYDSMGGSDATLLDNLAQYMKDEARDKCGGKVLDTSTWKRVFNPPPMPRQRNGCDCGVFTIMFADRLGLGKSFDFDQPDMEDLRVKVLHSLVSTHISHH